MKRLQPEIALQTLAQSGREFVEIFRHGSLTVEIYRPNGVDRQTPHTRDEIYVVLTGSGWFVKTGAREPFEPGEVLFAPAGVEHRFEDFTDDFTTWAFFYDPAGGEQP